jgi:cyclophilin family peptidyl-prolyl cis-trans isomerase
MAFFAPLEVDVDHHLASTAAEEDEDKDEEESFVVQDKMTTIRKSRREEERRRSVLKWMWLVLVAVAVLLTVLVVVRLNNNNKSSLPAKPQVRTPVIDTQETEEYTAEEGGRIFQLELGKIDGDSSGGTVILRTKPSWAPLGVEQFHKLMDANFFDECRFFRVVNNFIVQFGINGDPNVQKQYRGKPIKDDPVETTNARGTLTFATSGPNTRTTQLFINTHEGGNAFLDKQGFSPIAEVIR